jgi:hypothetical protein
MTDGPIVVGTPAVHSCSGIRSSSETATVGEWLRLGLCGEPLVEVFWKFCGRWAWTEPFAFTLLVKEEDVLPFMHSGPDE